MEERAYRTVKSAGTTVPGVPLLVTLVEEIRGVIKSEGKYRKQCETLVNFCAAMVKVVEDHERAAGSLGHDSNRGERLASINTAVDGMKGTLEKTVEQLSKITEYNIWTAITRQDKITEIVYDCLSELIASMSHFVLTSHLDLTRWQEEMRLASRADHHELMTAVEKLSHRDPVPEERPSPSPQPTVSSGTQDTEEGLLRLLQARLRIYDFGSAEYANAEKTLRELQLELNMPLLPFADLEFEARRIDPFPVHSNATTEVWKGSWLGDETTLVAMKCLRQSMAGPDAKVVERFHRQYTMLRDIRHPNIIKLFGVCDVKTGNPSFVFPWIENGNVLAYLQDFPNADRMLLMLEVARGIVCLHSHHPLVVHRALQPSNVLVDNNGRAVVSDFGLAKAFECLDVGHNNVVSNGAQFGMRWMAPEMSDSSFGPQVDVYAWAMTTLHVMSDLPPFHLIPQPGRVVIEVHKGVRPARADHTSEHISDECWSLLEECWDHDPTKRPTMAAVLERISRMRPGHHE